MSPEAGEVAVAVQDGPRPANRFFMWAGHNSIRLMIPAVTATVLFTATGRPGGDMGFLSWVVSAVWIAWFLTIITDFNYHEARLCERCIAATPLDPQAAVKRWDWILRFYHTKRAVMGLALGVTTWYFFGALIAHHHWWGYAITVICTLLIAVLFTALHQHRRLYPWCPYCRWGDGGQEEVVPDPDPAASVS